jgi:hypothetical protein
MPHTIITAPAVPHSLRRPLTTLQTPGVQQVRVTTLGTRGPQGLQGDPGPPGPEPEATTDPVAWYILARD